MKKVMLAIYCRISQLKESGKDRSINDQKKLGIKLSKELNLPYKVYIDEGISGTNDIKDRPAFSDMLNDIDAGIITHVYAYDQSRLERSPEVRLYLKKQLKENDIKLFTETGEIDLDSDELEMLGDILSSINAYSVRLTKKKVKSVLKRNAEEGKAHGILPYGYTKDDQGFIIIDNEESEIVKRIYDLSLKGTGTNKIAEILNADGVPTRYNKIAKGTLTTKDSHGKLIIKPKKYIKWSGNSVRGIIKNTFYKGERNWKGNIYKVPIIIDTILWRKVQDNLEKNRNNSGKNVKHKYLLRRKIICGACGRNYYGRTRVNKRDHYYMCSSKRIKQENCGNRSINIDVIEDFIWQRFFADKVLKNLVEKHFENTDIKDKIGIANDKLGLLNNDLSANNNLYKKALRLILDGIISDEEFVTRKRKLMLDKEDIEIKIKNLEEEIYTYNNSNNFKDNVIKDLYSIKKSDSHELKLSLIEKYIKSIKIFYFDKGNFKVNLKGWYWFIISFNIPNIDDEWFFMEKDYNIAWDVSTSILIPLSNKFKEFKEEQLNSIQKELFKIMDEFFDGGFTKIRNDVEMSEEKN